MPWKRLKRAGSLFGLSRERSETGAQSGGHISTSPAGGQIMRMMRAKYIRVGDVDSAKARRPDDDAVRRPGRFVTKSVRPHFL